MQVAMRKAVRHAAVLRKVSLRGLAVAALVAAALPAEAAVCLASASALAFGIYDPVAAGHDDTTATVTVVCTPGVGNPLTTAYTITIAGTGTGNDAVRSIPSGAQRLYYQLYKDAARTVVWGNGGSSGSGVASSVTSATTVLPGSQTHSVYARMTAGQRVPAAIYVGSLVVTVEY